MCNAGLRLNREYIRTLFKMLTGLDDNTSERWQPLRLSAEKMLITRLKPGVDINAEGDRLCMAAAGIAAAQYRSYQKLEGEELRVGGISLKSSGNVSLRSKNEYFSQISDLLLPEGFAFVQTPEDFT